MSNKRYESGRRFEWAICAQLREQGWIAQRTAGSHGIFDVVAIHPRGLAVRFIQAKALKNGGTWMDKNWAEMRRIAGMREWKNVTFEAWIRRRGEIEIIPAVTREAASE